MAKQLARREYKALSKSVVKSSPSETINEVARLVQQEFNSICSNKHNSMLRGYGASIKNFSWDAIWNELQQNTPNLVMLLSTISPNSSIILKCTIICMLLKQRHPHMALLQRVISVMLYGNAVHKQVSMI